MDALPLEKPYSKVRARPVPDEIRLRVRQKISQTVELGNVAWGQGPRGPMPLPTCSFDLRGTAAGMAVVGRTGRAPIWHLRINAELAVQEETLMLREVVPHEVAHLMVVHFYGPKAAPHGVEWQRAMRALGQEPSRTHQMQVTPARTEKREFLYRCACKDHSLTARRHNKIVRAQANYRCNLCGKRLVFVRGPDTPQTSIVPVRPVPSAAPARDWPHRLPPVAPSAPQKTPSTPQAGPLVSRKEDPAPTDSTPTEKQLAFARTLALRHNLSIPPAALASKRSLSEWISSLTGSPR